MFTCDPKNVVVSVASSCSKETGTDMRNWYRYEKLVQIQITALRKVRADAE